MDLETLQKAKDIESDLNQAKKALEQIGTCQDIRTWHYTMVENEIIDLFLNKIKDLENQLKEL
mgnify:CR=1 FL=1